MMQRKDYSNYHDHYNENKSTSTSNYRNRSSSFNMGSAGFDFIKYIVIGLLLFYVFTQTKLNGFFNSIFGDKNDDIIEDAKKALEVKQTLQETKDQTTLVDLTNTLHYKSDSYGKFLADINTSKLRFIGKKDYYHNFALKIDKFIRDWESTDTGYKLLHLTKNHFTSDARKLESYLKENKPVLQAIYKTMKGHTIDDNKLVALELKRFKNNGFITNNNLPLKDYYKNFHDLTMPKSMQNKYIDVWNAMQCAHLIINL